MSIQLHPDINQLNPESLCYSIYSQLYLNFFNAQDQKDETHPYGITEGDETSTRLKNTAYDFASAISGSVAGEGGNTEGGILLGYLKKSGGDMSGTLRSNYGFEAGIDNTRILYVYNDRNKNGRGVQIEGDIRIGGDNLYLDGRKILCYDHVTDTTTIQSTRLNTGKTSFHSDGEIIIGDKENGIYLSPSVLLVKGCPVYHSGNANLQSIDWNMKNGFITGNLQVTGGTLLNGVIQALHGVELGTDNYTVLSISDKNVVLSGYLAFTSDYGIKIEDIPVLIRTNDKDIQLGAVGGDLLLGNSHTKKLRLFAGITDIDGDNVLISKYGTAYFPNALTVRHNYGNDLLSSYRVDDTDEGMIIHRKLRFGSAQGTILQAGNNGIDFISDVTYTTPEIHRTISCRTGWEHRLSNSLYAPHDRISLSLYIKTDTDFISTNVPLEAEGHIGINSSLTRLADEGLYFNNENYLLSATGGIQHHGNAFFIDNLSSELFSSGFAGSGWAILRNETTGNISATFDELTIRKKVRIYELEVQKASTTNGSLWISDSCSGDKVIKL